MDGSGESSGGTDDRLQNIETTISGSGEGALICGSRESFGGTDDRLQNIETTIRGSGEDALIYGSGESSGETDDRLQNIEATIRGISNSSASSNEEPRWGSQLVLIPVDDAANSQTNVVQAPFWGSQLSMIPVLTSTSSTDDPEIDPFLSYVVLPDRPRSVPVDDVLGKASKPRKIVKFQQDETEKGANRESWVVGHFGSFSDMTSTPSMQSNSSVNTTPSAQSGDAGYMMMHKSTSLMQKTETSKRKKGKKGTCVDMADALSMPREAFEVNNELMGHMATERETKAKHAFRAGHLRRSIMLHFGLSSAGLGMETGSISESDDEDGNDFHRVGSNVTVDSYHRADEHGCVMIYMAVVMGLSTFDIPKYLAQTGAIPGVLFIVVMSATSYFLCVRLAEVPIIIEKNLNSFADTVSALLPRPAREVTSALSICSWWGMCMLAVRSCVWTFSIVLKHEGKITNKKGYTPPWYSLVVAFIVLLPMALSIGTRAKTLRTIAKASLMLILAAFVIETGCSFFHGVFSLQRFTDNHTFIGSWEGILDGGWNMTRLFFGLAVFPYVVAEMIAPENAPTLAWKGCRNICVCYLTVGVVGYFGWGDEIKSKNSSVITQLYDLDFPYSWLARLIALLFCIKTVVVYPLLFWPLCREIESFLEWKSAPVMLRLPWALRRLQRMKIGLRVFLVLSSILPLVLNQGTLKIIVRFLVTVPISMMNSIMPAIFCVAAALVHRKNLMRGNRSSSFNYIGGSLHVHIFATIAVTTVVCYFAGLTMYRRYYQGGIANGGNTDGNNATIATTPMLATVQLLLDRFE